MSLARALTSLAIPRLSRAWASDKLVEYGQGQGCFGLLFLSQKFVVLFFSAGTRDDGDTFFQFLSLTISSGSRVQ